MIEGMDGENARTDVRRREGEKKFSQLDILEAV
jgi:hypothetical protein